MEEKTMPRYIVQRNLGKVTEQQLEAAARKSKQVREASFPDIAWEHSHVVQTKNGMRTYCVYSGPSVERIKAHAGAAGLPAEDVLYRVRRGSHQALTIRPIELASTPTS